MPKHYAIRNNLQNGEIVSVTAEELINYKNEIEQLLIKAQINITQIKEQGEDINTKLFNKNIRLRNKASEELILLQPHTSEAEAEIKARAEHNCKRRADYKTKKPKNKISISPKNYQQPTMTDEEKTRILLSIVYKFETISDFARFYNLPMVQAHRLAKAEKIPTTSTLLLMQEKLNRYIEDNNLSAE